MEPNGNQEYQWDLENVEIGFDLDFGEALREMESENVADIEGEANNGDPDQYPEPILTLINGVDVRFPGRIIKPSHDEIITNVLFNIQHGKNILIECPNEEDRRLGVLAALLAYCRDLDMEVGNRAGGHRNASQEVPSSPRTSPSQKIFYGVKSFEEIDMVIHELQKFKRTGYLNVIKMDVLAPHDKLCERYTPGPGGNFSCSYPDPRDGFTFIEPTTGAVHSVRDLVNTARHQDFCPYYFCKDAERISQANIVFCPQEFILSPFFRDVYGMNLEQAIVVFDDGNNIETAFYDQCSINVSTVMLYLAAERLQDCLNAFTEEYRNLNYPMPLELMTIRNSLRYFCDSLTTFSEHVSTNHRSTPRREITLQTLRESGLGQNEVNLYLINFRELFELSEDSRNGNTKLDNRTISNVSKILTLLKIVFDLHTDDQFNQHGISFHTSEFRPRPNAELVITFAVICSNPKIILEPIMRGATSVIIGSGCLPSKEVLLHEFQDNSFTEAVTIREQDSTNCFFGYCGVGPHGVKLDFKFTDRDRTTVHEEAGEAIRQICKAVPGGVIVFFPSEFVLKTMHECWSDDENRSTSILDEIKTTKHVFTELKCKVDDDVPREIEKFSERCLEPLHGKTGAVFFCLHRGRVNKIMDFKNNEVNMIVSCGLPYSAYGGLQAVEKRNYHQLIYPNNNQLSKGWSSQWYNAEMFHIVSQTLAHCVRNGKDWVGGIILDGRMSGKQNELGNFIPPWIYRDLKGYADYKTMMKELNEFVTEQRKEG